MQLSKQTNKQTNKQTKQNKTKQKKKTTTSTGPFPASKILFRAHYIMDFIVKTIWYDAQ